MFKVCSCCHEDLPLVEFAADSTQPDKLKYRCRDCISRDRRQRRSERMAEPLCICHRPAGDHVFSEKSLTCPHCDVTWAAHQEQPVPCTRSA